MGGGGRGKPRHGCGTKTAAYRAAQQSEVTQCPHTSLPVAESPATGSAGLVDSTDARMADIAHRVHRPGAPTTGFRAYRPSVPDSEASPFPAREERRWVHPY